MIVFSLILLIKMIIECSAPFKLMSACSGIIPVELLIFEAVLLHVYGVLHGRGSLTNDSYISHLILIVYSVIFGHLELFLGV